MRMVRTMAARHVAIACDDTQLLYSDKWRLRSGCSLSLRQCKLTQTTIKRSLAPLTVARARASYPRCTGPGRRLWRSAALR